MVPCGVSIFEDVDGKNVAEGVRVARAAHREVEGPWIHGVPRSHTFIESVRIHAADFEI